ncbi:thyroid adenoma-associated protein homolog [Tachyglossus aculeatus]|uniref:thyroid adenoma-associated protein homolog n=1 Tax=Tachyglossus aculeatus TaxID=9261 RepID=UPI0018F54EC0|nr:thyroid adenoma-associated protein homolog [Tachyglossus aculeatus]
MVVKKKKEVQVAALVLGGQEVATLKALADADGQNLASLLLRCAQLSDGVRQIHCLKQMGPLLEKAYGSDADASVTRHCLDVLGVVYLSLGPKNPLKKVLASTLNSLPDLLLAVAGHSFTRHLLAELETADVKSYPRVMDNLACCLEDFHLGKESVKNLVWEGEALMLGIGCVWPQEQGYW